MYKRDNQLEPELFMFFVTEEQIDSLPADLGSHVVRAVVGEDVWLVACLRRAWQHPVRIHMYDLANTDAQWFLEHLQGQNSTRDAIQDVDCPIVTTINKGDK